MALAKSVYTSTRDFPKEELYGLTSQMRRSAVSISSNIAEGYGRGHLRDYIRFLQIARASVCELQSQVVLSAELGFLSHEAAEPLFAEAGDVFGLIHRLIESLKRKK